MLFNGTTSIVTKADADIVGTSPYFSIVVWMHPFTVGESQGRIFVLDEAGNALTLLLLGTDFRFSRVWSGGTASWDIGAGTPWAYNRTTCLFLTYDGTSTANDPVLHTQMIGQDGGLVPRTMSEVASPSGSLTAPNTGYTVGNRADTGRTFDGPLQQVQVWDRVLSRYEGQRAAHFPGSVRQGLRLHLPLENDTMDRSGRGQHGVGTAVIARQMIGLPALRTPQRRRLTGFATEAPPGGTAPRMLALLGVG